MTAAPGDLSPAAPPTDPELPLGARPRWPAWAGFAAMGAGTLALVVLVIPLIPVLLFLETDGAIGALALLVLLLVQDSAYVATAVGFAYLKGRPRAWQFGLRPTPFLRTGAIALAATLLLFGFELGYIELLGVDETNVEDLGGTGVLAAIAVSLAVIVVAPVTEELFFRAFFYRSLRNRLRVWSAVLINSLVFGSLHFQGIGSIEILPVIAVFGAGVCLVYELTGSVFAPIAIHAAFNTLATVGTDAGYAVPLIVGVAVVLACALVPARLTAAPSPFPPLARA
jgi:membrane protease YdiL (CAAX protease family)